MFFFPFLFAAFLFFYLQRFSFICSVLLFYLQRSSFLFAAFLFLFTAVPFFVCSVSFFSLQRSFFVCCVPFFLFAAFLFCLQRFFFVCSVSFLFAAFLFYLQRFFFVCSVSFLFAAYLSYLQRIFFVCSVSFFYLQWYFLFAARPLWATVFLSAPQAPACSKTSFHSNCLTQPITIQALINERDKTQTCLNRNEASDLFSEMNQICYCKQNTLGRGKLLISHQDFIFMFK